jgi:Uma2 family endonuclease
MTAAEKISDWISPEEYLEGERYSQIRHEYVDGCVYAMAGASGDHNLIAGNLFAHLWAATRGGRCHVFTNDMKVKVSPDSDLFYYPDVLVACDPSDNAKYFRERPALIFEVLSPETERLDRREKLFAYQRMPSLRRYILLEQESIAAKVYYRSGDDWESLTLIGPEAILELPEIQARLRLGALYERTALELEQGHTPA